MEIESTLSPRFKTNVKMHKDKYSLSLIFILFKFYYIQSNLYVTTPQGTNRKWLFFN